MDFKSYHQIWNDTWQFFKRYMINLPMTEAGWTLLIDDMCAYVKKSEHQDVAKEMMLAAFHELEAEHKRRKTNEPIM